MSIQFDMKGAKSFWFSSHFSANHWLFSADGSGLSRNKRFRLRNGQPLHEPAELLLCELFQLRFISRPLEPFLRQALVQQDTLIEEIIKSMDRITAWYRV